MIRVTARRSAAPVSSLLNSPAGAAAMGAAAAERVREHFLAPRSLLRYAQLLGELVGASQQRRFSAAKGRP